MFPLLEKISDEDILIDEVEIKNILQTLLNGYSNAYQENQRYLNRLRLNIEVSPDMDLYSIAEEFCGLMIELHSLSQEVLNEGVSGNPS